MKIKKLHNWDFNYQKAAEIQNNLAKKIICNFTDKTIRSVAGLDCAFSKKKGKIICSLVVFSYPKLELLEQITEIDKIKIPYIPGMLSFREAPVCIKAAQKLKTDPDLFLIDGQGIAHPRRLGLAAHLGLFLDKPTIGCAKSRLCGKYKMPAAQKGSHTPLYDEKTNEMIGAVLRTRTNVKPLFISIGNRCTLEKSIELTLVCTTRYRMPEPTRIAHQKVTKAKARLTG